MAYSVVLKPRASDDIRRNAAWMFRHYSPQAAARWSHAIEVALATLEDNPRRCPAADEAPDIEIDLRLLMQGRRPNVFRILFTIEGGIGTVHRVRHAAQDRLTADDL